jgi:hypothetical protein
MKGWRTFAVQAIVGLFGLAETLDWSKVLDDRRAGAVLVGVSIVNTALRFVTTTPPGKAR